MQILICMFYCLHSYSFLSIRGIWVPFKYEFNPYQVHCFQSRIEQSELRNTHSCIMRKCNWWSETSIPIWKLDPYESISLTFSFFLSPGRVLCRSWLPWKPRGGKKTSRYFYWEMIDWFFVSFIYLYSILLSWNERPCLPPPPPLSRANERKRNETKDKYRIAIVNHHTNRNKTVCKGKREWVK